jgi:hypothetical protein
MLHCFTLRNAQRNAHALLRPRASRQLAGAARVAPSAGARRTRVARAAVAVGSARGHADGVMSRGMDEHASELKNV